MNDSLTRIPIYCCSALSLRFETLLVVLVLGIFGANAHAAVFPPKELSPGDPRVGLQPEETTTQRLEKKASVIWQVSTFNAANFPSPGPFNRAAWAGRSVAQEPGWVASPGYGNGWDTVLECHFLVVDPSAGQSVGLEFDFNYDTEPGYDFFSVEYETNTGWQEVLSLSGSNKDAAGVFQAPGVHYPTDVAPSAMVYAGNDYGGPTNSEVGIRFRFRSDGGWSDQDGNWNTDGAVQIDNIRVTTTDGTWFEDFEQGSFDSTCWSGTDLAIPPPPTSLGCKPPLPPHDRIVGFGTRGYWFVAPTTFDIAAVKAAGDLGPDRQSVQIIRIQASDSDFLWPLSSTNFTTLYYLQQAGNWAEHVLTTPLRINAGDRIGILGGTTNDGITTRSSYSPSLPGPFTSEIAGFPVNFFRLATDQSVSAGPISSIFYSPYSEIGRFDIIILDCKPTFDCACTPNWARRNGTDPTARIGAAMVYDSTRDRTVLFGGRDRNGNYLNDTWEYDGTTWTRVATTTQPSPRYLAGVAFDSGRGVTVLYGGWDSNYLGDTWEWDGSNWSQILASTTDVHHSMGMAYDPLRQVVVRYGGSAPGGRDIGTWEYDGSAWTVVTISSPPGFRSGHEMVFAPSLGKILLYGGQAPGGTYKSDTWTYDGGWVQLTASGPGGLQRHTMAADAGCGAVYLYGGMPNNTSVSDQLWKFESGAWSQIGAGMTSIFGSSPGLRRFHSMVYEASSGGLLLVGGTGIAINPPLSYEGTFRYACGQVLSGGSWDTGLGHAFFGRATGGSWPDSLGGTHMIVSNIGSSGEDGVYVNFGEAKGYTMGFNPVLPPANSANPAAAFDFELLSNTSNDIEDEQFIALVGEPAAGGTGLGADYGALGASGFGVEAWHGGVLIDSQNGFVNGQIPVILPDAIGSMRTIVRADGTVAHEVVVADPAQATNMSIGGVPVAASRLVFSAESATVPVTHLTSTMWRGRNYGTVSVDVESIGAFGTMMATGVGSPVALRGENAGTVLRLTLSPQDGVADEGFESVWQPLGSCDRAVSFNWMPLEGGAAPPIGATLHLGAKGEISGASESDLGSLELVVTNPTVGAMEMEFRPDYAAVGSATHRVQLFEAGALIAEFPGEVLPFSVTAPEMPSGCGKDLVQIDGYDTARFHMDWPTTRSFTFSLPGVAGGAPITLSGDEIAVVAENPAGALTRLESFSILADGFTEIVLTSSQGIPTAAGPVTPLSSLVVHRAYPNPFNPRVVVQFETVQVGAVTVEIFDVAGRRVRQLLSEESLDAGRHQLVWDGVDERGRSVGSGVYLIRVSDRMKTATVKATLIR